VELVIVVSVGCAKKIVMTLEYEVLCDEETALESLRDLLKSGALKGKHAVIVIERRTECYGGDC